MKNYSRLLFPAVFAAVMILLLLPENSWGQSSGSLIRQFPVQQNPKVGEVVLREAQDNWDPFLKTVRRIHEPGVNLERDEFLRLKAAANAEAEALQASGHTPATNKVTAGPPPTPGTGFVGNSHNADPADNGMAISAAGKIISVTNTRVHVYDTTGTELSSTTLSGFASGVNISFFVFDPVVVYDPVADRFIVVFLAGANPSNSRVVVAFSQTNDPAGAYNIYTINGNVNNEGVWIDFPQIGMSTDELFITGNRFDNQGNSPGATIWQITKADGYSGASSITTATFNADGQFSIHPVEGGPNLYGPHFYLIRSNNGSSNTVSLYRVTNTIGNNGILEPPLTLTQNNNYSIPPDADQASSQSNLATNDVRIQTSYYENNRIEYAHNTGSGGVPSIFHGTIEVSPFVLSFSVATAQIITFSDYHIAYPSLAYGGAQATNGKNESVVSFNYAGPNHRPGHAAIWFDGTNYSQPVELRTGLGPITGANPMRWGDYTDSQERPGKPGEVWVAGTFGNQSNVQRTWIHQLLPPTPVATEPRDLPETSAELQLYPNPANERIVFEFPVEVEDEYELVIRDLQGRVVRSLVRNWLPKGEARLAFNTGELAGGMYVVSVENARRRLYTKQFAVQH